MHAKFLFWKTKGAYVLKKREKLFPINFTLKLQQYEFNEMLVTC